MLPEWYRYRTHCHVLGAAQSGKTSWAAYCRRRHILAGNPIVSLDYKSGAYQQDVAFIAEAAPDTKAFFLNVSCLNDIQPYNPFLLPEGADLSSHASRMAEVVLKTVSREALKDLQTYRRIANVFFAHVAVSGEPISHAARLLEWENRNEWAACAQLMPDEQMREAMMRLSRMDKSQWLRDVLSCQNRLDPLVTCRALRTMTQKPGLSISRCFHDGVSLFVNACPSATLPPEAARIVLGLVLSDLLHAGLEYATDPRPCLIYCDEIQEYATSDFGSTLDLALASGMRFTAIHHFQGQMDDRTRDSLEINAGIQVLFGGMVPEDRLRYAERAFARELNHDVKKQPRISHVTEYDETPYLDRTSSSSVSSGPSGDTETSGGSVHRGYRLVPRSEEVITGYDFYSMDEKRSRLAEQLILPPRHYVAILPDKTVSGVVPTLRSYLYDSPECLQFRKAHLPDEPDFERSTYASSDRDKKKPARLFHAQ